MLTIEKDLQQFAQDFYISKNGSEKPKIETSLNNIKKKLKLEFGNRIVSIEIFGSYKRKTILPRTYDPKSDIDLLIVFDHKKINVNPSTYRKHLHEFAKQYYPNSISYKSKPSVVIELYRINYDLVPAFTQREGWFNVTDEAYIPKNDTEWRHTDIKGFSQKLEAKNEKYNFNVKRIIRLLKAWNAKVNYPIASYTLEQEIAYMDFTRDTIESGFFYAINKLSSSWSTDKAEKKVEALKENALLLKQALEGHREKEAIKYLKKILPI
jgi:predicted nucleotidyltransferase